MSEDVDPAPELTADERCSDCGTKAIWAGGKDLRVCPRCFNVLWGYDRSAELAAERAHLQAERNARAKVKRLELAAEKALKLAEREAARDAAKK